MAGHGQASLKDIIAHPKVWQGRRAHTATAVLPTGFAKLDRYLPVGGWPRSAITEIFLERYGIGELSLLMPALASLSHRQHPRRPPGRGKCLDLSGTNPGRPPGRWIVWIDPPFIPYAPALTRCGVNLDQVLMVHSSGSRKQSLWAVEQALRSNASIATLAWLATADGTALRRLQLAAEERDCWTILFRPMAELQQRSPAALRLKLSRSASGIRLEIVKCRGTRPGTVELHR
jgi:hypothetical protein